MRNRLLRAALLASAFALVVVGIVFAPAGQAQAAPVTASRTPSASVAVTAPLTDAFSLYLPAITGGAAAPPLAVDVQDRAAVLAFFQQYHQTAPAADMGWTGDHAACDAGTTSPTYRRSLQTLVNFFRAMAGVPAGILFRDDYSAKAQQAALMMSVNGELNHTPPPSWACYTPAGAEAANASNLSIWSGEQSGYHGIKGQMEDDGPTNFAVGHRRWILCPSTQYMGTGDVPESGSNWAANALWVVDDGALAQRPAVRDDFVAWPPGGYVPRSLVYGRWSFMLRDADFSAASVHVRHAGADLHIEVEQEDFGYCENTLVWVPTIDWNALGAGDQTFQVEIDNVQIDGQMRPFTYEVTVIMGQ